MGHMKSFNPITSSFEVGEVDDKCRVDLNFPTSTTAMDAAASVVEEPHDAMEFDSHEAAYDYYKAYAKSVGFGTAKLSSRRSRASKEFIDAKFSCIRYGTSSSLMMPSIPALPLKLAARQACMSSAGRMGIGMSIVS